MLITGAAGFLGSFAADFFHRQGWIVHGLSRNAPPDFGSSFATHTITDLSSAEQVRSLLANLEPELVLHLAGPSDVSSSLANPAMDLSHHLLPMATVIEGLRHSRRPARFLLVSSAAVYGQPDILPVPETARLSPISPYGFHKAMQEMLCDEYQQLYGLKTCKARVFSTFGEGLRHLAVWDIARRALQGDFTVRGTGDEVRDYLYGGDVARALFTIALGSRFGGEAINVASGVGIRIADLAEMIYKDLGIAERPVFRGNVAQGNPSMWIADISRLSELGFVNAPISSQLSSTLSWIRNA